MYSQSFTAQLVRMTLLLIVTLFGVHHCQPLLDSLAQQAMNGGCHQQSTIEPNYSGH